MIKKKKAVLGLGAATLIGTGINALSSLIGGAINRKSQEEAQEKAIEQQTKLNTLNANTNNYNQFALNLQNQLNNQNMNDLANQKIGLTSQFRCGGTRKRKAENGIIIGEDYFPIEPERDMINGNKGQYRKGEFISDYVPLRIKMNNYKSNGIVRSGDLNSRIVPGTPVSPYYDGEREEIRDMLVDSGPYRRGQYLNNNYTIPYNMLDRTQIGPTKSTTTTQKQTSTPVTTTQKQTSNNKSTQSTSSNITFSQAFAAARKADKQTFEYKGKKYTTQLAGEVRKPIQIDKSRTEEILISPNIQGQAKLQKELPARPVASWIDRALDKDMMACGGKKQNGGQVFDRINLMRLTRRK